MSKSRNHHKYDDEIEEGRIKIFTKKSKWYDNVEEVNTKRSVKEFHITEDAK